MTAASMALRSVVGQLRSKAPSLAQRLSDGALRYHNAETTLAERALLCNVCDPAASSSKTMIVDKLSSQRGYSSGISLVDAENGSVVPADSLSCTDEGLEENDSRKHDDVAKSEKSGPKVSERHNLAMIFTCNVCQTRSAKTMSRQTYEQGVVIVRCGGCKNLHLIADRLGWFGEPGSVEDFLMQKGVEIRKGSEESYEFSMEDLAGWSPPAKE